MKVPTKRSRKKPTRIYRYVFPKSNTRTIYWEVDLNFPSVARRDQFPTHRTLDQTRWIRNGPADLGCRWSSRNGKAFRGTPLGWGWVDAGYWPIGIYRVDFYVGKTLVASGSFQIN